MDPRDKIRSEQAIRTEAKLERMVAHLRANGPMQSEGIKKMFNCGTELAKKAMELSGYGHVDRNYWISKRKAGEKIQPVSSERKNLNYMITRMYRPEGRNILTEAWI